ncbi:MAG: B12-binding domain-containing radical SAM protein [Candidatus Brocadiia bacterium]
MQSFTSTRRRRIRLVVPAYPAFNIYSGVARHMTALGPVCVATAVNDVPGWDVEVIDENNYRREAPRDDDGMPDHEVLQKIRPVDAVGLYGGLSSTVPRLFQVASYYQELGIPTLAGGHHFVDETIGEALSNGVDYIVRGEGEEVIKEMLEVFGGTKDKETVDGIAYRGEDGELETSTRELIPDLDALPVPDFSLLRYGKVKIYPVGRVRGCGMNCEFCAVKGRPRYASPERLMEQFMSLYEKQGATRFFVVDDLFGQDREETMRLCRMLRDYQYKVETKFRIMVQIRLDKARDDELLKAMREARIRTLAIGFESPIAEELEAMNKHLKPDDMVELTRLYHRAGFWIHGMFIFGYPMKPGVEFKMSAKERVKRFRRFISKARIDTLQVLLTVPLPGTELRKRLKEENRVFPTDHLGWEYYDGNFPLFEPDEPLTPEQMQVSIRKIMGRFYRFSHFLSVALNILSFPAFMLRLHDLKQSWRRWTRKWWRSLMGVMGWRIIKKWTKQFRKGNFTKKLNEAKQNLDSTDENSFDEGGADGKV